VIICSYVGGEFAGLVSLISSPYSSELLVLGGGLVCLIKMHKPEHPIHPMVNWRGAPAYKLARLFTQKFKQLAPLPNRHNINNTRDVIKKLNDTPILPHFTLASLDITNLCTNIPVAKPRTSYPTL